MNNSGVFEIDSNDQIAITGQSILAPTGTSLEEVFGNQLNGNPKNRFVSPNDFTSSELLKKELEKSKNQHAVLKNGMSPEEADEAIDKMLDFPASINGALTHKGEVLDDAKLINLILEKMSDTELSDEYKSLVGNQIKKGKFDPSILQSIYMSLTALDEAGMLGKEGLIDTSTSINLGNGYAGLRNVERDGMIGGLISGNKMSLGAKHLVGSLPNMTAPIVANVLRSNAGATVDDQACAAAGYAYERAIMQILLGKNDVATAGGCDAVSDSAYALSAFGKMGALAKGYNKNPNEASRPFANPLNYIEGEKNPEYTKGFVLGEGGGASVLELESHAKERNVETLAKIAGIGTSTCNPMHVEGAGLSSGTIEGQALSMKRALESAGITPQEFLDEGGVVFAHGTSTEKGDEIESNSIYSVFGKNVNVTALKGVLGHSLGGSAAQGIAVGVSSFINDIIPGTHNYSDENRMNNIADINIISENQKGTGKYILVNAFGFGGHNVSILLENPA